ncbi:MAG TPA: hypothetical protein VF419_04095 [Nitrososphaeraceae archaeon]
MKNLILGFSIVILALASVSFVSSVIGKSFEDYANDLFAKKQQTYNDELEKMIYLCMELEALSEEYGGIAYNPDLDEETIGDCGYLLHTTDTFDKK